MRSDTDAGHRLAALLIGDVAERRQHRLGVLDLHGRLRILLIAVPSRAGPAVGEIPGCRERCIA